MSKAPWPKSKEELSKYIDELLEKDHDYNTSAEAMSLAAQAAFNFIAHEMGCTGFQASWAQMAFIRDMRNMELPFTIVDSHEMLFPQYDPQKKVDEFFKNAKPAVARKAKERLEESGGNVHPEVEAHWRNLSQWYDINVNEEEEK